MIAGRHPLFLVFLFTFSSLLICCASSPNTFATIVKSLSRGSEAYLQCYFNIEGATNLVSNLLFLIAYESVPFVDVTNDVSPLS